MGFCLVPVLGVLGFAYVLWILASKENGAVKLIGQILSVVLVVAVLLVGTGHHGGYCGKMGYHMMGAKGSMHDQCPMKGDHMKDMKGMHGAGEKEVDTEKK